MSLTLETMQNTKSQRVARIADCIASQQAI